MFTNTKAVVSKITKDLSTLSIVTDLILQIILIVLTGYNIYISIGNTVKLVIYIILLVISACWLVYSLTYYASVNKSKEAKETKKDTALAIKCIKLIIRLFIVIYSIVNVFLFESDMFSYLIAFISLASLIIQVATATFSFVIRNYINLLEVAVNEDIKPYLEMKDMVKNIYNKVTHPVYEISNTFLNRMNGVKAEQKEEEEVDKRIEDRLNKVKEIKEGFLAKKETKEQQEKDEQRIKDEEFKEHKKEVIDEFKGTIKNLLIDKINNKQNKN